jgi:uncharacterized protein with FMN-binding domain
MSVRKLILAVHIVVNAAWMGAVLAMLVLVAVPPVSEEAPALHRAAFALNDLAVWTSLAVLFTSLCFALFTHWGFVRFRWIALKWLALAALAVLGVFVRTPAINALAACADVPTLCGAIGIADHRVHAIASLVVELFVLVGVVFLSVTKPWGRMAARVEPGTRWRIALAAAAISIALLAIVQSAVLSRLRRTPIAAVNVSALAAGTYEGAAQVGVDARVRVTLVEGTTRQGALIDRIDVIALPGGHYSDLARGVTREMIDAQRIDVDGVSGATTTSRAIQKATEAALQSRR